MGAAVLAMSLLALVAANDLTPRTELTANGHTVTRALGSATAATVGVSSEVQDEDDSELLPSTERELQLTAAISEQSQKVKKESSKLIVLQAKTNITLQQQQSAAYKFGVATRVSQRVLAVYMEAEKDANNSELVLRDAQAKHLTMTMNKTKTTTIRKGIEMQLDIVSGKQANETSTLELAEAKAALFKFNFDVAENESNQALDVLANRSGDLQEAMDKLNALNDELTAASADRVEDATEAVHEQALIVANLTNMVGDAQAGANKSLEKRGKAAAKYAAAAEALDNVTANMQDYNDSIEALTMQKDAIITAEKNASIQVSASEAQLAKAKLDYNKSVEYVISLRQPVQKATDQELEATMFYAQENVTVQTLQVILDNQTRQLQEEMDKLNLLNSQLEKEQDQLHRAGSL